MKEDVRRATVNDGREMGSPAADSTSVPVKRTGWAGVGWGVPKALMSFRARIHAEPWLRTSR